MGMDDAASEALIKTLIDAVTQPQFIYEHAWEDNDIVLWDDYRMMHSAVGHRVHVTRVVHRTTLRGQTTVGRIMEPTNGRDGCERVRRLSNLDALSLRNSAEMSSKKHKTEEIVGSCAKLRLCCTIQATADRCTAGYRKVHRSHWMNPPAKIHHARLLPTAKTTLSR
ncbi:TauD/TfdA dioxygenase family protein [Sphingomonas paeninsulae]|uniref:TauD/TfdA dioxygenase family protein n=1 Tax=Sphingomonas paeninsulae TaxID=2319844 RepID=UPI003D34489D